MHQISLGALAAPSGTPRRGTCGRLRRRLAVARPLRFRIVATELALGNCRPGYRSINHARSFRGPHFGRCFLRSTTRSSTSRGTAVGLVRGRRERSSIARTSWLASRNLRIQTYPVWRLTPKTRQSSAISTRPCPSSNRRCHSNTTSSAPSRRCSLSRASPTVRDVLGQDDVDRQGCPWAEVSGISLVRTAGGCLLLLDDQPRP